MSVFDPYYKWLGIRPEEQPPHHYRLLGIVAFETDADVIDTAAEQRTTYLRTCATGEYVAHSQRLLNEVATARLCLLNPQKKAAYDAELKAKLAPPPSANPLAAPAMASKASAPFSSPTKVPAKTTAPAQSASEPDPLDGFDVADELGAALSALPRAPSVGRTKHGGSDKGGTAGRSGAAGKKKSRGSGPPRTVLVGGGIGLLAVIGLVGGLFVFGGFGRGKSPSGKKSTDDRQTVVETPSGEKRTAPPDSTRPPSVVDRPSQGTTGSSGTQGSDVSAGSWTMPLTPRGPQAAPAVAPFDVAQAKAHQEAWAKHLSRPMETTNSVGMRLRLIPPGRFTMGTPPNLGGKVEEQPVRTVTITKPLYFGVCEVTQEEFVKTMGRPASGTDPSHLKRPALGMQRFGAVEFCERLSKLPAEVAAGRVYRLPTEAEWEHACRAGTTTLYFFGDDAARLPDYEWFAGNSYNTIRDVSGKRPNPWGLHDLCGNVGEWCADRFAANAYAILPAADPLLDDPKTGRDFVVRSGNVFGGGNPERCRPAARGGLDPSWNSVGFRVVCEFGAPPGDLAAWPTSGPPPTGPVPTFAGAPPPAVIPFDAAKAKAHQEAWAKHLGEPVETSNSLGMRFVVVPPGRFAMGSPPGEVGRRADEEQVEVVLTQPLRFGMQTVTQRQFQDVMGAEPWKGKVDVKEGADYAASFASWNDAVEFCRRLTERERAAGRLPTGEEYRLPTEAEREYAARAGTSTTYSCGDDESRLADHAWYEANSRKEGRSHAHAVGLKQPNPWGLFDVHGNVWDWCGDWSGDKLPGGRDPTGPASGSLRVLRGGSWCDAAGFCRSAYRNRLAPDGRLRNVGFRVVRTVAGTKGPTTATTEPRAVSGPAAGPLPQWIWHGTTRRDCVLRKEFPGGFASALLRASADDAMSISVDGRPVAENRDWKFPTTVDLRPYLKEDRPAHVLHVAARNAHEDAGFVARLILTYADGRRVEIVSDGTWESAESPDAKTWTRANVLAPLDGGRWNEDPTVQQFGRRLTQILLGPPPAPRGTP